jgi:long-chain fatty acid transport protein
MNLVADEVTRRISSLIRDCDPPLSRKTWLLGWGHADCVWNSLPRRSFCTIMAAVMKLKSPWLCIVAGLPAAAYGLGLRVPDQDAMATARGNAFVATADNPAAIYYNPAGLTDLSGFKVRTGGYGIWLGSHYSARNGAETDSQNGFQGLPNVFYSYKPSQLPLAFGLGVYSPYGLGMKWPENSSFRTLVMQGRIAYFTAHPVVAWQILPTLSVAAGPTLNYSELDLRQGILVSGDQLRLQGHDFDEGFTAGLLWRPHEKHSFGVNYRSATTLNYRGHLNTTLVVPVARATSEAAAVRFNYPQNIVLGWSFRPTPAWNLEFNVDWTDWDTLDTLTLSKASGNLYLPYNWQSSFLYEWGVTRYLGQHYSVSAGYIFSGNSIPARNFSPAVPDSDRHLFSVGFGYRGRRWSWDAAYQFAYGPTRDISGSVSASMIGQSADGRYEYLSHALSLSLGYAF